MHKMRLFILSALTGAATLLSASALLAQQAYPSHTITLVVSNSPGDVTDLFARLLAPEISKALGQPVIVVNKPGAGLVLGYQYVATEAPADGYTLLVGVDTNGAFFPATVKNLSFDPVKDLPPVINVAEGRTVIASRANAPWKSFDEMMAYAKANPDKLKYGENSYSNTIFTESMLLDRGVHILRVPYSSSSAKFAGLLTGENDLDILSEPSAVSMGSRIMVLGQTGDSRGHSFPNVPTFNELGFPQIRGSAIMLNVRSGTPKPIIDKLYTTIAAIINQPDMKQQILSKLQQDVEDPSEQTPEAAGKVLDQIEAIGLDIAHKIGLQPQ